MSITVSENLDRGMRCLVQNLGVVEAEQFVANILRERADYTKWQQQYFDSL